MADIRVTDQDRDRALDRMGAEAGPPPGHALPGGPETDLVVPARAAGAVAPDHQLPAHSGPRRLGPLGDGSDPEATRHEIMRTRERMSDTIDQIEDSILRRKERLQEQLDVRSQLRERLAPAREVVERQPLAVVGGTFALALALGYLTGERDEPRVRRQSAAGAALWAGETDYEARHRGWRGRARQWENRSRELLHRNEELEMEVRRLRGELDGSGVEETSGWLASLAALFGRGRTRTEYVFEREEDEDLPGDYHPSSSYEQAARSQRGRAPGDPLQG